MNPATEQTASVAAPPRRVASKKAAAKKAPSPKRVAPKAKRAAKSAKTKKAAAPAKSKNAIILSLIGRKGGATLAALMAATDWQKHSIRGFISLARSRRGLKIASAKNKAGERIYRMAN